MVYFHSSIHMNQSKKTPILACEQSSSALIDLVILIAVIGSCGFLIYPYVTFLLSETLEILEDLSASMIYGFLGLTIVTTLMTFLAIRLWKSPKCGQPGCRGLQKQVEFEIQIEKEDCVKNSDSNSVRYGKKGLFEFPKDYHRELEADLKKMAPANGRVVLVFRARCGCSVVRMEVSGPKKNNRKIRK